MITLIIVDCQIDFITGSLAVEGASTAINNIVAFIKKHKSDISKVIFTQDWHPYEHCSFTKNGGPWPVHCVNHTAGAGLDMSLIKVVEENNIKYSVLKKGMNPKEEQYGAFDKCYIETGTVCCGNAIFSRYSNIIVCGIAGDFCVKHTIHNLYSQGLTMLKVYLDGVASIDDGTTIKSFVKSLGIETIKD